MDFIGTRASYAQVMGMRIVAGRAFDPVRHDGRQEALIDRRLAEQFFPTGNPIGTKIPGPGTRISTSYEPKPADGFTIVGVVEQARLYDVHQDGRPQLYIRTEDWGFRPLSFVVRTGRDPESIIPEARAALRQVDPRVAMGDVKTMEQIVGDLLRPQRTSAVAIAAFALGALLLAAMGLFGVVSSSVTRRRHEMAVRLALGADHGRVLRLVLGEGALLVGDRRADWDARHLRRGPSHSRRAGRRLAVGSAHAGGRRHRPRRSSRWLPATCRRDACWASSRRSRFARNEHLSPEARSSRSPAVDVCRSSLRRQIPRTRCVQR